MTQRFRTGDRTDDGAAGPRGTRGVGWVMAASLVVGLSEPVAGAAQAAEALAAAEPASSGYFDRAKEGWFWYQDPPAPPPPTSSPPAQKPDTRAISPAAPLAMTWEELKQLSVETIPLDRLPMRWLKALGQAKLEFALDDPVPERVKAYILVQRAIFERSERFAHSWQVVMYQHPELDAASFHPTSDLGRRVDEQQEEDADDRALREVAQRAGLFFFFTSTCKFCQAQAQVLKVFADTYGFAVLPISLDGRGLPEFPEVNADNGIARNLEVKMVPMLYLAIPDEKVLTPVGAGVLTLSDLKHRILVLAGRKGHLVSSSPSPSAPKAP